MKSKEKKTNNKPIDFKALEDKLNVFTFMHNDFNKTVDKENEICNNTTDIHSIKEKDALNEKEKFQTVLSELISSCEKKKEKLNNYINVTQNVINKNNDIIEKEKIEIANLISEKNTCIEILQRKIDCLKEAHCSLNVAIINVFNNLNSFINAVTKGKINIEGMMETNIKSPKKDTKISCEGASEASIQGDIQNEECWRKKICDENKMKLYESINIYRSKLKQIKLLINSNTNCANELIGFNEDKSKNDATSDIDSSVLTFHGDEKTEKVEVTTLLCDKNIQDSMLLTKDNIVCDTLAKIKKGDMQNTSRQDTIEERSDDDDDDDDTSVVEEESDENKEETDKEETDEEETDEEETDEEETDEEETDEEETNEEETYEEETYEEETDEEDTDEEETDKEETDEKREDSSVTNKLIDVNDDKSDQESFNIMKSVISDTRKNLSEMRNDDTSEKKQNVENDILYFDANQCLIEKKDNKIFEVIKNLNFDYLSYFQEKLKNS